MAAGAKYHIIILRKHRSHGGDRSIERVVHADTDGREYVFFDCSSWWIKRVYIKDGRDAGFYVSSGYREYHGKLQ